MLNSERIREMADELDYMASVGCPCEFTFAEKANRDATAREAKSLGTSVKKTSTANQVLDPRYVEEGRHLPDLGMANEKQFYARLYHVSVGMR